MIENNKKFTLLMKKSRKSIVNNAGDDTDWKLFLNNYRTFWIDYLLNWENRHAQTRCLMFIIYIIHYSFALEACETEIQKNVNLWCILIKTKTNSP